jgi:hypothetical protein
MTCRRGLGGMVDENVAIPGLQASDDDQDVLKDLNQ